MLIFVFKLHLCSERSRHRKLFYVQLPLREANNNLNRDRIPILLWNRIVDFLVLPIVR